MATKREIKAKLDAAGISYPADALKGELIDLMASDPGPVPADPVADVEGGPTAEAFEDVSGLCRQCKKPADHKHIGV